MKLGTNIAYTEYDFQRPGAQTDWGSSGNLFYAVNTMAPIYPMYVRNADGTKMVDKNGYNVYDFGTTTDQARAHLGLSNPGIVLNLNDYSRKYEVFNGKWNASINLTKDLKFTANLGLTSTNQRRNDLYNVFYGSSAGDGGAYVNAIRNKGITQQYMFSYIKEFGRHGIDVLAGYEGYEYKTQILEVSNKQLYNPNVAEIGNTIYTPAEVSSSTNRYATEGYIARLKYDFDNTYYASISYRKDASSRFHPDNRWGDFFSFGGAWIISKEDFFQNLGFNWLNHLKLKASYGQQGNDNLMYNGFTNYYPYLDQYQIGNLNDDFASTFYYKGNKDITWETSNSLNVGSEFTMFNNKLSGDFEFFSRKTSDLLYYQPVPISLGYASQPINVGSMRNVGYELNLDYQLIKNTDFEWSINANATTYKNEVLELDEYIAETGIPGNIRIIEIGGSMYDSYLRKYAGVDENTGKALYYKADDQGNYVRDDQGNKITTDDWSDTKQVNLGSTLPDVYGGFGTRFKYKNFDLSASFSYQLGGRMYDTGYAGAMHAGDSPGQNWHSDILNAWTPDNRDTNVPRLNTLDDTYLKHSSRFLISSNYLSLNNLTVGFALPSKLIERVKMSNVRVYFAGDNLFLLTKRQGVDPRQDYGTAHTENQGAHVYSAMKTLSVGLNVTF